MKKNIFLIIPAAGLGTRMRQVTPDLPKELLPVGHKPAIQYTVEEGFSANIKNIIIIISRQKEIIRQ
jgi:UTP--glucose-1-phosphate uridylyltransferase